MVKHVRIEELKHVANGKFSSVCFVHHTDDTLSRKHDCLGLANAFLVRRTILGPSNDPNEIEIFKSLSGEHGGF